ncbi:GCG_CRPN prefix-to-repeats domain-containing protein [Rhodoblastus sp.]|uniref:GCG_CRPN prefix-to-repeats domain-containing protein n=1 Tax=Rhodoblastus sp. TaxID=1962975 RepID=UPI003F9DC483
MLTKIVVAGALALTLGLSAAQAEPLIAPMGIGASVILVSGGCGPYGHRGPYGGCQPGGQWGVRGIRPGYGFWGQPYCRPGYRLGPYRQACWAV